MEGGKERERERERARDRKREKEKEKEKEKRKGMSQISHFGDRRRGREHLRRKIWGGGGGLTENVDLKGESLSKMVDCNLVEKS